MEREGAGAFRLGRAETDLCLLVLVLVLVVVSMVFEEEEVVDRVWRIGGVRSGVGISVISTSVDFRFLSRGDPSGSNNVSVSESK
jgi:hypothetical protein